MATSKYIQEKALQSDLKKTSEKKSKKNLTYAYKQSKYNSLWVHKYDEKDPRLGQIFKLLVNFKEDIKLDYYSPPSKSNVEMFMEYANRDRGDCYFKATPEDVLAICHRLNFKEILETAFQNYHQGLLVLPLFDRHKYFPKAISAHQPSILFGRLLFGLIDEDPKFGDFECSQGGKLIISESAAQKIKKALAAKFGFVPFERELHTPNKPKCPPTYCAIM